VLSAAEARALLVDGQRLTDIRREDGACVADVLRTVVGLQAQDAGAASLGLRARLAGSTAPAVDRERFEERSIARVWCMRGTLHLVAAEDVRWLVALLGPVGLRRNAKRIASLGVDQPAAVAAVRDVLADRGPLTRHELAAEVLARGVRLADDPQSAIHLVAHAAMRGSVIETAPRSGKPAYGLIGDWLGDRGAREGQVDRDAALAELARRYVAAYPPAGPEDLAAWSGLGIRDARHAFAAIESDLEQVQVLDRAAWVPRGRPKQEPKQRTVRLLPAFDGLLLAHRDRALTVRPQHARQVLPGGGVLRPTLLVDGQVEGTWKLDRGRPVVTPFAELPAGVSDAVAAETDDVVRHRTGALTGPRGRS
jgi:hypothetical protein